MPSKDKVTYGSTLKGRAKRLLEALLAYVKGELEDVDGISLSHRWQDETTKQPKLVIETQLRTLEFLTAKDKHEGKLTKPQIRQALNEHLKDFLHILEDNRSKTQGKEEWHFTLKLWSNDTQKNLEQFEIEWERLRPEKSKQQEKTLRETVAGKTPKSEDKLINWQEICRQNLAQQKQLTTNLFTNAYGVTPQLDEIYVPLAIVERKPSKPPSRDRSEEKEEKEKKEKKEKEAEKLIPIAEERFFEDVLRQGQSEISQGRKIAIIGEPGAGKTTRLQKIADWILEQDLGLPIWVSLADLTQPTITQYIEDIWLKQTGQSLTIDALTQQKHLIWLLLDGLDEMTSKVEMRHVSALLGGWVQAARVVVTCRVNVWEADKNAFSGFDVFRNLEFNPEQVRDYIRRWFAEMKDAATGESLEEALAESENSRLKELIQNPLRLWMLCQIWQTGGGLPETQAGLYAQFVDWVYSWKADEEILDQREAIDTALARLALAAMDEKDEVSRLRLRESWVSQFLGSRPIFQAVMKLGWLNRVERFPEAICVFYHATFQEYFAALAVEDWDYFLPRNHVNFPVAGKEYRIFEAQWKQVILLWLGRGEIERIQKQEFIDALVNFEDGCGKWRNIYILDRWENLFRADKGFYEYRAYFLAGVGISEFHDYSQINEIIRPIVKWKFGYFDPEKHKWVKYFNVISNAAMEALQQTHRLKAIAVLVQQLNSPDLRDYIRREVAASLGKIDPGNQKAIDALVEQLTSGALNDYNPWEATLSLAQIASGNQKAIAALEQLLKLNLDDSTRCLVAVTLGDIDPGNRKAIAALEQLLNSSILDDDSRRQVAVILKEIDPDNPKAITALEQQLASGDLNNYTRCLVAASLGKIDPGNQNAIDTLVQLLKSSAFDEEYDNTSRQVAQSLGEIGQGNQTAIDALVEQLTSGALNNYTRGEVAESLGEIGQGNQTVIHALVEVLTSGALNDDIRREVAASLGKIDPGNQKALAVLVEQLTSTNLEDTRWRVTEILGKIGVGNQTAIDALVPLLTYGALDDYTRWLVAESLAEIDRGNQTAIDALVQLLNSLHRNDLTFLRGVIQSLGKIAQDNQTAIDALVQQLNSPALDDYTRGQVAASLNKMKIQTEKQFAVITVLKANFNDSQQIDKNCYELIWDYAENLPYPDFYRAWHG
jgi:predicted NACHT family NTPase